MANTITLTLKEYKCLREHLEAIDKIIGGRGLDGGLAVKSEAPKTTPKEKRQQKVKNYMSMIETGQRGKKPDFLKK